MYKYYSKNLYQLGPANQCWLHPQNALLCLGAGTRRNINLKIPVQGEEYLNERDAFQLRHCGKFISVLVREAEASANGTFATIDRIAKEMQMVAVF